MNTVERALAHDGGEPLERAAHVDPGPAGEAGAGEGLAGDLGVAGILLEGVEPPVLPHPAQQADAAVAAERADLDGAPGAGGAGEHLEVEPVHRPDGDLGEPGGAGAGAHLAQDLVLGRVDRLGPRGDRRIGLAEPLHGRRTHRDLRHPRMALRRRARTVRAGRARRAPRPARPPAGACPGERRA
jgi:hypothetical protein